MDDGTTTPTGPSQSAVIAAIAAALLPLTGKTGLALSAVVPALEGLLETFKNHGTVNYSIEGLTAIVVGGSDHLAKLAADVNAMPDDVDVG